VFEARENLNLSDGLLLPLKVQQLVAIVLLDGYSLPRLLMGALPHLGVGPLANLLAEAVVFDLRAERS